MKNHFPDYQKSDNSYENLKDKIQVAIRNGEWVEKQCKNDLARGIKKYDLHAYTNIHLLVGKLLNPNAYWLSK
jgi:hypothetical protein